MFAKHRLMRNEKNELIYLTLDDSMFLKGFAILLVLFHHLFYKQYGLYDDFSIGSFNVVQSVSYQTMFSISIFAFITAYGLTSQAKKTELNLKSFYLKRLVKLYMNYWLVFLIFVPIGVFVFNRSLASVYGDYLYAKFLADFFGVINVVGLYGYNVTWWYISAAIVLYLSFPFLYWLSTKKIWLPLLVAVVIFSIHHMSTFTVRMLFPVFSLGIILNKYPFPKKGNAFIWGLLLVLAFVTRFFIKGYTLPILFDSVLAILAIVFFKQLSVPNLIQRVLSYVGKHSMNIFLFHTFIYLYWFRDFVYASRCPVFIFATLLLSCLLLSVLFEKLKELLKFDAFVSKLTKRLILAVL